MKRGKRLLDRLQPLPSKHGQQWLGGLYGRLGWGHGHDPVAITGLSHTLNTCGGYKGALAQEGHGLGTLLQEIRHHVSFFFSLGSGLARVGGWVRVAAPAVQCNPSEAAHVHCRAASCRGHNIFKSNAGRQVPSPMVVVSSRSQKSNSSSCLG